MDQKNYTKRRSKKLPEGCYYDDYGDTIPQYAGVPLWEAEPVFSEDQDSGQKRPSNQKT